MAKLGNQEKVGNFIGYGRWGRSHGFWKKLAKLKEFQQEAL